MTQQKCKCDKETELSEMFTILKRLDRTLSGNGQKGLIEEFSEFKGQVGLLRWVVGLATPLFAALLTYILTKGV